MVIYGFRTSNFANQIYLQGTQRFTARDTFSGIPAEYRDSVLKYAKLNFPQGKLDDALANGWIAQDEYDATMAS